MVGPQNQMMTRAYNEAHERLMREYDERIEEDGEAT